VRAAAAATLAVLSLVLALVLALVATAGAAVRPGIIHVSWSFVPCLRSTLWRTSETS
jgi:hypothetical protein